MTGEPENLVLTYLRRIDGKIDRLAEDMRDLKLRRLDRLEDRIERIERRLDIVEA